MYERVVRYTDTYSTTTLGTQCACLNNWEGALRALIVLEAGHVTLSCPRATKPHAQMSQATRYRSIMNADISVREPCARQPKEYCRRYSDTSIAVGRATHGDNKLLHTSLERLVRRR